jgi:hypothetical protein
MRVILQPLPQNLLNKAWGRTPPAMLLCVTFWGAAGGVTVAQDPRKG